MAGSLFVLPRQSPLSSGAVVPNSKLTFSRTTTSTLQNTYSDSALTTPNSNPVMADASGVFGKIYLDPSTGFDYRCKWTTSADVQIWQEDDIKAGSTSSTSYRLTDTAPTLYLVETDASANNGHWRIRVDGEQLSIDVGNDAESSWVQALTIDRTLNVVDTINLKATANQSGGLTIGTQSNGSYTGSLTGLTTVPTATITWRLSSGIVTVTFGDQQGTSNTNALTVTGAPAAIAPAALRQGIIVAVQDNGAIVTGAVNIQTDGSMQFAVGLASGTFTASGTKGIRRSTFAYPL